MTNKKVSKELLLFLKLVSFFKKLRHQKDVSQAYFTLVNDLYNIIPFKQSIVWTWKNDKVVLKMASGQVDVNQRSPYAQFVSKHIENTISRLNIKEKKDAEKFFTDESYSKPHVFSLSDFSEYNPEEVKDWLSPHSVCLFLRDENSLMGGVWFERDQAFGSIEMAMLDDIGDAFADKLNNLNKKNSLFKPFSLFNNKVKKIVFLIFLLIALFPVRFSMTVTAEVVSESVEAVSVPYNGLIKDVVVSPNQNVEVGDILFSLEKTGFENDYRVALQALETAKRKLEKTERETFGDASKRSDLRLLKEQIKLKKIEVDFSLAKLNFADVKASRSGTVLFSDKNDLLGQPIQAGQQILTIADPSSIELLLRIPAEGMINIDESVPVKFFLNTSPFKSSKATLYTVSYKPTKSANGSFGYSARAKLNEGASAERIGLMGTAKVYGSRTVLIVNILRRPFIGLRNLLGL
jgi:hypothetical protein